MADIELAIGFLPFATEGSLSGGGIYDVRRPHVPENIAFFQHVGAGKGNYTKRDATFNIFRKVDAGKGDYVMKPDSQVKGEAAYKMSSYAKQQGGFELGTFPSMSGLTISMGCDMGASYGQPAQVVKFFEEVAKNSGDNFFLELGQKLSVAAGKRGVDAFAVTAPLRPQIQITQQQVLDIQNTMWRKKKASTLSLMQKGELKTEKQHVKVTPINPNFVYPPLLEILTKLTYANAFFMLNFVDCLNKQNAVTGKRPETKEEIVAQCDAFLAAMVEYDKMREKDYCKKSGFVAFTEELKKAALAGNKVVMKDKPLQVTDILDPKNPVGDWMTSIMRGAKGPNQPHFRENLHKQLQKEGSLPPNTPNPQPNNPTNNNNPQPQPNNGGGGSVNYVELIQMAMSGKGSIKGSVGKGGDNQTQDVLVAKALLTFHGYMSFSFNPLTLMSQLMVLGSNTPELEAAIVKFQTDKGAKKPDGRIDPGGKTLGWLNEPKGSTPQQNNNPQPQPNTGGDDSVNYTQLLQTALSGKGSIKGSVGKGGDNQKQDVMVAKALLTYHGYMSFSFNPVTLMSQLMVLGTNTPELEAAIVKFQADKGIKKPDGRIDPGGKTIGWLNEPKGGGTGGNQQPPQEDTGFATPALDGNYFGCYH